MAYVEPFLFQKEMLHLCISKSLPMMWPCWFVVECWSKSLLSAANSNQQIPAGHMVEAHFPTPCLQQSAVHWSCCAYIIGGGNAVIWMFLLLLWRSVQRQKCCTLELLHLLAVWKQGRGSQKELPFSMISCSTVRLSAAHAGWDGMYSTGYHCTELHRVRTIGCSVNLSAEDAAVISRCCWRHRKY